VGQNRANMTRILDLLRSEQLVRVDIQERDARRKRVTVTPAGRRLVKSYAARFAPIVAEVFSRLEEAEKRDFERVLRTVISSMDAAERIVGRCA
jgi:DNA-binding MarR family transcriptional regulator